jgi:hypothetical protein
VNETLRVPEGDDVLAFIAALPGDAFVIASGWVEGVELSPSRDVASRPLPGRVALLSLVGAKSGPLMAALLPAGGESVVGGELLKARSAGVSLAIVGASASAPAASKDARPQVPPAADRVDKASGESEARPVPSAWAKIAALPQDDDEETDEAPKYGDRVHHFVFGLCDVMVIRGERMKIRDVHGPGRLREIHLSAVRVLPPTVEDGKRVFKLAKRT